MARLGGWAGIYFKSVMVSGRTSLEAVIFPFTKQSLTVSQKKVAL